MVGYGGDLGSIEDLEKVVMFVLIGINIVEVYLVIVLCMKCV